MTPRQVARLNARDEARLTRLREQQRAVDTQIAMLSARLRRRIGLPECTTFRATSDEAVLPTVEAAG